jgi:NAD-dependent deacetylase
VHPAAGLPAYTLRSGGKLVIVNNQVTDYDDSASMLFAELTDTFIGLKNLYGYDL